MAAILNGQYWVTSQRTPIYCKPSNPRLILQSLLKSIPVEDIAIITTAIQIRKLMGGILHG
jgi:hypothetical protein